MVKLFNMTLLFTFEPVCFYFYRSAKSNQCFYLFCMSVSTDIVIKTDLNIKSIAQWLVKSPSDKFIHTHTLLPQCKLESVLQLSAKYLYLSTKCVYFLPTLHLVFLLALPSSSSEGVFSLTGTKEKKKRQKLFCQMCHKPDSSLKEVTLKPTNNPERNGRFCHTFPLWKYYR